MRSLSGPLTPTGSYSAVLEQRRMGLPEMQQLLRQRELDVSVRPAAGQFVPLRFGGQGLRDAPRNPPGGGCRDRPARGPRTRCPDRNPARPAWWPSASIAQAPERTEERRAPGEGCKGLQKLPARFASRIAWMKDFSPASYLSSGLIQLVSSLPSRAALIAYCSMRAMKSPSTGVCGQVLASADQRLIDQVFVARGRAAPVVEFDHEARVDLAPARHVLGPRAGMSDSARIRVRASSPRLVSCVAVAVSPCVKWPAR